MDDAGGILVAANTEGVKVKLLLGPSDPAVCIIRGDESASTLFECVEAAATAAAAADKDISAAAFIGINEHDGGNDKPRRAAADGIARAVGGFDSFCKSIMPIPKLKNKYQNVYYGSI